MKKLLIPAIVFMTMLVSCGRPEAPQNVKDNFYNMFPGATAVKWGNEENNEWEAEFVHQNIGMSACFKSSGEWFETETDIDADDLPHEVSALIDSQFSDYNLLETSGLEKPGFKGYEIVVKKGKETLEVQISPDGVITSQTELKGD